MIHPLQQTVLILGAYNKPDRYAYKAFKMLREKGHSCILVHPTLVELEHHPVIAHLSLVKEKVDTITIYVNPNISSDCESDIIRIHPSRVIFNPGSENPALSKKLQENGIHVEEACTLVLLSTNQF